MVIRYIDFFLCHQYEPQADVKFQMFDIKFFIYDRYSLKSDITGKEIYMYIIGL